MNTFLLACVYIRNFGWGQDPFPIMSKLKSGKGFTPHLLWGKNRNCPAFCKKGAGFTLIELLIVIAIIAIIAAVVYVALDPMTRFRDARITTRWHDISAILSAVKVDQVDNGGSYLPAIANVDAATWYMIGAASTNCNDLCDTATATAHCVDLGDLATQGYLASIPVSPDGDQAWSDDAGGDTGYLLRREGTGIITIQACDSEEAGISVAR